MTTTGVDKVYDGTTLAAVTYTDNRVAGDTLSISSTASFADKNVANGIAVAVTGITLGTANASNYALASGSTASTSAAITRKALSVIANDDSRVAGSAPYSGGNGVTYDGFVAGESSAVGRRDINAAAVGRVAGVAARNA